MANKRMFNVSVIDTDAFLDMPLSAQALYFHLNLRADDDGFIGNPKRIQRLVGASDDDLKLLVAKAFLIAFENGVVVVKHWRMHNTIRKDRYTLTNYTDEYKQLGIKENKSYTLNQNEMIEKCIPTVANVSTKNKQIGNQTATNGIQMVTSDIDIGLDKDIDKDIDIEKDSIVDKPQPKKRTSKTFVKPLIDDVRNYINEMCYHVDAERFYDYYESNGWLVGKNHMKDWKATIRNWERKEKANVVEVPPKLDDKFYAKIEDKSKDELNAEMERVKKELFGSPYEGY